MFLLMILDIEATYDEPVLEIFENSMKSVFREIESSEKVNIGDLLRTRRILV